MYSNNMVRTIFPHFRVCSRHMTPFDASGLLYKSYYNNNILGDQKRDTECWKTKKKNVFRTSSYSHLNSDLIKLNLGCVRVNIAKTM